MKHEKRTEKEDGLLTTVVWLFHEWEKLAEKAYSNDWDRWQARDRIKQNIKELNMAFK